MAYYVAEGVVIKGNITIGEDSGIWYNATIRGDSNQIAIGSRTNVQDNAVVHVSSGYPVSIGNDVIVHGCTVGSNTLIGMGAIILNGAVIGDNCIIGAGALVTQNTHIPDESLAFGNPAKVIRSLTPEEIRETGNNAQRYVNAAKAQLREVNCE